jgi:hypothetical protein
MSKCPDITPFFEMLAKYAQDDSAPREVRLLAVQCLTAIGVICDGMVMQWEAMLQRVEVK